MRLSFRKKIFFGQLILFILFILLLLPLIDRSVHQLVQRSLQESTRDLIDVIKQAKNRNELIQRLQTQEFFVFFRVSLLNETGNLLYDSHLMEHLGDKFIPLQPSSHPEVLRALKEGMGYSEGYSEMFGQKFAYVAIAFHFQGNKYILRTAFPFTQIEDLTHNFEIGFLILSAVVLLFFSAMTWLIFYRLSRPIQHIIQAIGPYREGRQEVLPHITLSRSIDEQDDFGRLANTLNALSEKVRLQIDTLTDEKDEKEAILESLGEGVIAVDASMQIRYVNFIGSKMLGTQKRHLIGKPFPTKEDKLLERCKSLLELCQAKHTIMTDSFSAGEGKKLYLDLIAAPKAHGSGAIIVLQDKSSHYKVLEMGKAFIANASHELRTPITIIKGFAETLQDLPTISESMLADITEKIVRNCQRMDTLVKNLLTLADIENLPDAKFSKCDLCALLDNCRYLLLSRHPQTIATLEKPESPIVIAGDSDLLELAVMNLFENAVKYSSPPAHIAARLYTKGDDVILSISDQGIGIPAADIEHIFERFYTVDKAHSRRLGGAGLGLSIVKTIIQKHDGTISATSTLGMGTTFTITLPG